MSVSLLRTRDVFELLGVSVATVPRWNARGQLPAGFRLASGVLRWREDELDAWLEQRRESKLVA